MTTRAKAANKAGLLLGLGMGLVLAGVTPAWAAPSPEQVKKAVDAGDLPAAENMLREVVREHGDSARAHYDLGEVLGLEGRHQDAVGELELARKIDPSLHFARSPETFQQHLAREESFLKPAAQTVPAQPVPPSHTAVQAAPPPRAEADNGMTVILVVGGLLLAALAIYLVFRRANPASGGAYRPATAGPVPPPYPPAYGQPGYAPVVVQEPGLGTGFLTGVLAGELMSGGGHRDTVVHETVINNVTENRVYENDRRPDPDYDSGSSSSSSDGWGGSSDGGSSSSSFDSGSSGGDNSSW
ncbi:tetratricopeptide repeat protein [Nitrospirillum amazonense]|uniref:Tetratricopeptide repeat protein n=1 Tax=Nitrospirillum amazonense TaxID=28077 RepID=A0A560FI15_9PROT|nr:tetratricopeptide repeat protein [Nitrospirillum amazonense]TWB21250.1 tetratricopeptide repeat protein [Nitrospirillum amazonense]